MKIQTLFKFLIGAVFLGATFIALVLPNAHVAKELVGYLAYCLPITATFVAGQAIFSELYSKNESVSDFNRRSFIQSFTFYIFGLVLYVIYSLWGMLESKNWLLSAILFFNAALMTVTSYAMYREFCRDDKNPFIRSLLGASFALCSILIFGCQLFVMRK